MLTRAAIIISKTTEVVKLIGSAIVNVAILPFTAVVFDLLVLTTYTSLFCSLAVERYLRPAMLGHVQQSASTGILRILQLLYSLCCSIKHLATYHIPTTTMRSRTLTIFDETVKTIKDIALPTFFLVSSIRFMWYGLYAVSLASLVIFCYVLSKTINARNATSLADRAYEKVMREYLIKHLNEKCTEHQQTIVNLKVEIEILTGHMVFMSGSAHSTSAEMKSMLSDLKAELSE